MDLVDSDKKANIQIPVWKEFEKILKHTQEKTIQPEFLERFAFYERSKKAFAIIQTGFVTALYKLVLNY